MSLLPCTNQKCIMGYVVLFLEGTTIMEGHIQLFSHYTTWAMRYPSPVAEGYEYGINKLKRG